MVMLGWLQKLFFRRTDAVWDIGFEAGYQAGFLHRHEDDLAKRRMREQAAREKPIKATAEKLQAELAAKKKRNTREAERRLRQRARKKSEGAA